VLSQPAGRRNGALQTQPRQAPVPLKDLETHLIRQAVQDARGNVVQAALALGISRATVYRKLGKLRKPDAQ
jgi:transcriptional regulator of acetoin/glycerol metabolism